MKNIWQRFVENYVNLSFKAPWVLIGAFLAITGVCGWIAAGNLKVVTNLSALLPENTPSVRALDESKERIGSTDFFVIAIESKAAHIHSIAKMQDQLAKRIREEWDDAGWIQIDRDTSFFHEHALYYLPKEKLLELHDALKEEHDKSVRKNLPGMVDLLDDDDEEGEDKKPLENWYDEDLPRKLGLPPQVGDKFESFFARDKKDENKEAKKDKAEIKKPPELVDRMINPTGTVGVVMVQLGKPSTDLDYAKMALTRGTELIESIDPSSIDPDLNAQVVGAYRSFKEVNAVADDGKTATMISVSLVFILMFAFFRSPRTVVAVVFPLFIAGAITMAITAFTYGRLTVLTVFVLAMLAGMGIDYGIHLFGRAMLEFRSGKNIKEATTVALNETGSALLTAALTTIVALLALLLGHFEGFKEFGIVASYGLIICVAFSVLAIPPIIAFMERIRPLKYVKIKKIKGIDDDGKIFKIETKKLVSVCFVLGLLLTAVAAFFAPKAQFEYDFRNLRAPSTKHSISYGSALGKKSTGTTPAVILAHNRKQMKQVHEYLKSRSEKGEDHHIKSFITVYTFVPEQTVQQERYEIIKKIGKLVKKRSMQKLKGEKGRMIKELTGMVDSKPFTEKKLPQWALNIVTERDQTVGNVGHLYAKVKNWDAGSVMKLQDDLGYLEFDGKWLPIASSSFILSDVVKMVQEDGKRLVAAVLVILVVIMLIFSRSIRGTLVLVVTIVAAGIWTVGIMGLFDVRIGLYNIIVVPVILGVGIDGAIHMYHRHIALGRTNLTKNLKTTGLTVTASSWTTMAGFIGLLFVMHKGLRTIGVLATIGVGVAWLAVVLLLPFFMEKFVKPKI